VIRFLAATQEQSWLLSQLLNCAKIGLIENEFHRRPEVIIHKLIL